MPLLKFESMLKTNNVYFFDSTEFEEIIEHYLTTSKHSLAKKAIQLGLEQHPASIVLKLLKVELCIFEENLEKATELVREVEDLEPDNDEMLFQKAVILSKINLHTEAIEALKKSLKYTETPLDVWSMIGMEYLYMDCFTEARLYFEKCIDLDIEDYSALYNIIYCFDMEKKHTSAVKYLKSYVDKNPYSEIAWHQLGCQYFIVNDFKEALISFEYAILIDESFVGAYLEKAKTLEELKRYEEAIENYLIATELEDPTSFAYLRIGECFKKLKDTNTAIKYYKKAVHEDPLLDRGWGLLANAYYSKEDYQKALYYINKALQIEQTNVAYWHKYADINIHLHLYKEAIKALKKCVQLENVGIEVYIALADVLYFVGSFNDALSILIKAKKTINTEFAEIEYRLCGLFLILDKEDYALVHLKNGLAINFEYHIVMLDLFTKTSKSKKVQDIINNYKKV